MSNKLQPHPPELEPLAYVAPDPLGSVPGHEPDLAAGRKSAIAITAAANELRSIVPAAGAYVSESNFFDQSWQESFWGPNYPRLQAVKAKYDPMGYKTQSDGSRLLLSPHCL